MSEVMHYFWVADGMSETSEARDTYVRSTDYGAKCHASAVYFGSWKRTEEERDAAQSELSALRQELAETKRQSGIQLGGRSVLIESLNARIENYAPKLKSLVDRNTRLKWQRNGVQLKLTVAEQRNADAVRLLTALYDATPIVWPDVADFLAMTKPTESGASE